MSYVAYVKPYNSMNMNLQEVLNEVTILLACYPLLTFTEWVSDMDRRIEMGWFLLALIGLSLMTYITLSTFVGISNSYKKLRRRYLEKVMIQTIKERKEKMLKQREIQKLYGETNVPIVTVPLARVPLAANKGIMGGPV